MSSNGATGMSDNDPTMGPLQDVKVVEFAALGPLTLSGMMLADLGADVVRIERPAPDDTAADPGDIMLRGRRRVELDLKVPAAHEAARALATQADVVIEGSRPGVMERLDFGPTDLSSSNPGLIYGRLTGWGQTGSRSPTAGHDINYIATTGALAAIGENGRRPVPPLALVGDFGGGAMFLVSGVCAALYRRTMTGHGEVIDAAMADGARLLMTAFYKRQARGEWVNARGSNLLDGAAPFYSTYECSDGHYVAVGCVEGKFFAQLLSLLGISREAYGDRSDRAQWSAQRQLLAARFATRGQGAWDELFKDTDACVTPVLTMGQVIASPRDPQRPELMHSEGAQAPVPAPSFASRPSPVVCGASRRTDVDAVLDSWSTSVPAPP